MPIRKKKTKYTYRFLFLPETIGSIAYLSKMKNYLIKHVVAGYVLTCIGDERNYSLLESKAKESLSNFPNKPLNVQSVFINSTFSAESAEK